MADAKSKKSAASGGGDDQSMEEILQSIRKIIAEENDDPTSVDASSDDSGVESVSIEESDVLELTDAVQDDGSVVNVADGDVLSSIDSAIDTDDEEEPEPAPAPVAAPKPAPVAAPAPAAAPAPRPAAPVNAGEGLVSAASIAASAAALQALRNPAGLGELPFVSGNTVEGLVQQLLRPMLKEWLDANLPAIVQQAVEREVRRISPN